MKPNVSIFERNAEKFIEKAIADFNESNTDSEFDIIEFIKNNGKEAVVMASFIEDCGLLEQLEQYRNALAMELL